MLLHLCFDMKADVAMILHHYPIHYLRLWIEIRNGINTSLHLYAKRIKLNMSCSLAIAHKMPESFYMPLGH